MSRQRRRLPSVDEAFGRYGDKGPARTVLLVVALVTVTVVGLGGIALGATTAVTALVLYRQTQWQADPARYASVMASLDRVAEELTALPDLPNLASSGRATVMGCSAEPDGSGGSYVSDPLVDRTWYLSGRLVGTLAPSPTPTTPEPRDAVTVSPEAVRTAPPDPAPVTREAVTVMNDVVRRLVADGWVVGEKAWGPDYRDLTMRRTVAGEPLVLRVYLSAEALLVTAASPDEICRPA